MTQGMITIISRATKQVLTKIVVGDNGMLINNVIKDIKAKKVEPNNLQKFYELAKQNRFGCKDCLVIMDKNHEMFLGEDGDEELDERYRNTFNKPKFNPRWDCGEVEYLEMLEYPYDR